MTADAHQQWVDAGCPEPRAADRQVDDEPCEYEDCNNDADYRVQWDGGTLTYCCQRCSEQNRIYAKENGLLDNEVRVDDDGSEQTTAETTDYSWDDDAEWTFEAEAHPRSFARALEPGAAIADEFVATITPDTIEYRVVDLAKVALVDVKRPCIRRAEGTIRTGIPVTEIIDGVRGFAHEYSDYELRVTHTADEELDHAFVVDNLVEGRAETVAFDPATVRDAPEWPTVESDVETALPTPKVRGVLGALAEASDCYLALAADDGQLTVAAIDHDDEIVESWSLDADVDGAVEQWYSAEYLESMMQAFWRVGTTTLRFGDGQPLFLDTDGLQYMQAPVLIDPEPEVILG